MTGVILNADDYAMTRGISDAIVALAEAGRLSSTSAIVTTPHWPAGAKVAKGVRDRIAVGLHLNLTFAKPLGPMPHLAPDGILPGRNVISGRALTGRLDLAEIAAEIERQLDRFEQEAEFPPEFVDGHHHVHVLPGIRDALCAALKRRFPAGGPLLRDPFDPPLSVLRRRIAAPKALTAALLSLGFRGLAGRNGFATNIGFSGFSTFGSTPFADEFEAFLIDPGPRHMIMCHPGFPDDELGERDAIGHRRPEEYALLSRREDVPGMIWRPTRAATAAFPW